jgi:predicted transcriptional regulator
MRLPSTTCGRHIPASVLHPCAEGHMVSIKQEVSELLERLPDDCSIEDIQYHLYVLEKIRRGLEDAEQGRTLSHADVEQQLSRWRRSA